MRWDRRARSVRVAVTTVWSRNLAASRRPQLAGRWVSSALWRCTRPVAGKHRRTLDALGLKRHQQTVIQNDTPAIRGMINQISHLVQVTEVEE